jgi:Helix-turn-helix domain
MIDGIIRLRRAERAVDPGVRDDLRGVREQLEAIAGPTVRPAEAARLLGVSQPALKRWLDRGDIATVLTPRGRRELPLSELVELLEEIDQLGDKGGARPLTRVMRKRQREAEEAVDLERLLPRPRRDRGHRTAELQSLAYHRLIGERLDEEMVADARARLRRWRRDGRIDPRWADEWERILSRSLPQIVKAIGADSRRARELRQTSPFAGLLTVQERQRLTRAVEERSRA